MGFWYGTRTQHMSCLRSQRLAAKLTKKGARDTTGSRRLLDFMSAGSDQDVLPPDQAAEAARSLRRAAGRLSRADRESAELLAADAQDAADNGRPWTIGP